MVVTAYSSDCNGEYVIELCGAQPVFVEIQPDTFNMDPVRLQVTLQWLTANVETARRVKPEIARAYLWTNRRYAGNPGTGR